jgi:hypothetical protein
MEREKLHYETLMSPELRDYFGFDINVGDKLAKPESWGSGRSSVFYICIVTSIENDKIYLDKSKVPIKYPGRCINISRLFKNNSG